MKLSICNEMFSGLDLEEVFQEVKRFGYSGVEIAPFTVATSVEKISMERRREIWKKAFNNDIQIVGTHWILVCDRKTNLFKDSGEVNGETMAYLNKVIEFTSDIGGKIVVFGSPKQRSVPSGGVFRMAWNSAISAFKEIGDFASGRDVTICIEPLSRDQTNFINSVSEANKFIVEVNHKNIRLMLDVRSMCDERRSFKEIIKESDRNLRHFHANDCNGYIPGSGSANYEEIVQGLLEVGYSEYLSVEVFDFKPDAKTIAIKSLENLRRFFREYGNVWL